MSTTVYLIRHGETEWNMSGRWQGHADVPLNDVGRRQATLLAQHLLNTGVGFSAIYSSDLTRAYQTAWELGAAVRVPVQLLPPLREIDVGAWSGFTFAEIEQRFPVEIALLRQGQDIPRGGGETIAALSRRVVEAVDAIVALHRNETIALVTHGGCIRALLSHAASFHHKPFEAPHHIGNTSISVIKIARKSWSIQSANEMRHLEAPHDPELISTPPDDAEQPAA